LIGLRNPMEVLKALSFSGWISLSKTTRASRVPYLSNRLQEVSAP